MASYSLYEISLMATALKMMNAINQKQHISALQGFKSSRIQEFQGFKSSRIQEFQGFKEGTEHFALRQNGAWGE